MKLSEAIRLGAMLGPQCFGEYFDADVHGSSCALGAARLASGLVADDIDTRIKALDREVTWGLHNESARVDCPQCDVSSRCLHEAITHINDGHRWTRERIADWVESVERAHETQPVIAEAVTV